MSAASRKVSLYLRAKQTDPQDHQLSGGTLSSCEETGPCPPWGKANQHPENPPHDFSCLDDCSKQKKTE